jgi:hypothetical protein
MVTEIEMFEFGVTFLFVGVGRGVKCAKQMWIQETNSQLAFSMLLLAYRDVKINCDEQHAIFAHELESVLSLTVGFSKICCEL